MSANPSVTQDYASRLESINKMINKIAEHSAPLVKRHLDLKNPVTNRKHEWVDKVLRGLEDTVATTLASTTTTVLTVSGGTDSPKAYQAGSTTLLMASGEYVTVTSIVTIITNSAVLNIARGAFSSTPTTHAAGSQIKIINSNAEAFAASRNDAQYGARQDNYTMIFEKQLILSGSSQAVDTVGNESKKKSQRLDLTSQIMKETEVALLYSPKVDDSSNNYKNRKAGGFHWHAVNRGGLNQDMSAAAIAFKDIEDIIERYIKKGGDANKLVALCSVRQQRQLNLLKVSRINGGGQEQKDTSINNMVETYDFGARAKVEIMFHPDVRDDEIYFYQKDHVNVKPLQGRTWDTTPLAKTGDTDDEMIVGEYTFEFFNTRETLYRLYNLKTNFT